MSEANTQFSHAAPIFPVSDVAKSIEYYKHMLGFEVMFTWGELPSYAVLKRDDAVSLHLSLRDENFKPASRHVTLYVFVYNVDDVYNDFVGKGVTILNPVGDREYGMRDFDIEDPDGFILSFGTGLDMLNN